MRVSGRFIYLDNHTIDNLDTMYKWSMDKRLIELEAGNVNTIIYDRDEYLNKVMSAYIVNTHEAQATYCHFGVYSVVTNELIGYVDLQEINTVSKNAELSLSIPDEAKRNNVYGFDAFLTSLHYSFDIRKLDSIVIQTKINNLNVIKMAYKLGYNGKQTKVTLHNQIMDLIHYEIHSRDYKRIRNLTTASTWTKQL